MWLSQVLEAMMQDRGALPIAVKLLFGRSRSLVTACPFFILLNLCTWLEL